jgi:hypothetical protein
LGGAEVNDTSGFLEGDDADGRRLAMFYGMNDVKSKQAWKEFDGGYRDRYMTLLSLFPNLKIVMRIPLRYCFKGESN